MCRVIMLDEGDWYIARDHCTAMSSQLAVITNEEEQHAVVKEFNTFIQEPIWLGGVYDQQENVKLSPYRFVLCYHMYLFTRSHVCV